MGHEIRHALVDYSYNVGVSVLPCGIPLGNFCTATQIQISFLTDFLRKGSRESWSRQQKIMGMKARGKREREKTKIFRVYGEYEYHKHFYINVSGLLRLM